MKSIRIDGIVHVPIPTPYNKRERTDRRVLRNGRWQRINAVPDNLTSWLREGAEPVTITHRHD